METKGEDQHRTGFDVDALVARAREVRAQAHAPYSGYRVGVALLAEDGRVFVGVNVENSAYPSSLCAEHNAIGAAVTAGARRFAAVAVVTEPRPTADGPGRPGAPCGKCRQVLAEFGLELVVVLATDDPAVVPEVVALRELLPRAFTARDL